MEVADELGIAREHVIPHGRACAKVELAALRGARPRGRMVLVSGITPTRFGEGKTTVGIGLAMALRARQRRVAMVLPEPALGGVFAARTTGTGGGRARLSPQPALHLHFTGDEHAVAAAHNLTATAVDHALQSGALDLDGRIAWPWVLPFDDRALRDVVVGLGGRTQGVPRQTAFTRTSASEVMAVLGLATDIEDLDARLGRMVVGETSDGEEITARALGITDAMTAMLRDALAPNLVQAIDGTPAFVHASASPAWGHGGASAVATRMALASADDVVAESSVGFDIGGEKLLHLHARPTGYWPRVVVLVATVRALSAHGRGATRVGLAHLDRQVENVRAFGLEPIIALNVFADDAEEELARVEAHCRDVGLRCARCTAFEDGAAGADALASLVVHAFSQSDAQPPRGWFLYDSVDPLLEKVRAVAKALYGARDVLFDRAAAVEVKHIERRHAGLSVCIAKTPLSFSDDPRAGGLARDFVLHVRALRVFAGAGYVVARVGDGHFGAGFVHEAGEHPLRVVDGELDGPWNEG